LVLKRFEALSIRNKLLAMVLLPMAGVLPLLGLLLLWWSNAAFDGMLITKIRADLAVARGYFERVQGEVGASAVAVAESHQLHLALQQAGDEALVRLLAQSRERARLDFLTLRSADGRLRATDSGSAEPAGDSARPTPPSSAREQGTTQGPQATLEIVPRARLQELSPALLARIEVPLVSTLNAAPTRRTLEDRAMLLLSTQPVRDAQGQVLAWVQAGVLLNRNLAFIDHINEIVYPAGSLPFGSRGTATLFLDDVRISTNVRLFGPAPDERAIGTRVSQAVRDAVLEGGQTWLGRAFVVNDWYVSGYLPLQDGQDRRVGMLYVGYLERPFTWLKYGMLAGIGVIFFSTMIVAAVVSLRWARTIFRPIEQMEATMQRVESGALQARVGAVGSGDEIGRLAHHLDRLLDGIAEKTGELQRWNAELDAKVAERGRELESAQAQLLRSEKLAAVGQLTASIAHEINNPIAVIQGNLDLLRGQLPASTAAAVQAELKLIDAQVERMRLIVTQLLQFARPAEYAGYIAAVEPAQVLEDCLVLVGHLLERTRIQVRRSFQATRRPAINRNELQQVLVNLLSNAIHAMPEGGELGLVTRDVAADQVAIDVIDSGGGLDAELMRQLFQPFVTRKKDGTGLGLWISRTLVERYGGDLRAANREDAVRGAVFTVLLRCGPEAAPG
jgi:two-component system, NtrC family, sensor kinase